MWKAVTKYFSEFKVLKNTPYEFWVLNLVINFFEMLAYFAFITVLTLYLTDNIGLNDQQAGNMMGYFTLLITIIIFFAGFIIDSIGVKKALLISMAILIPTRLILGVTDYIDTWDLKGGLDFDATHSAIVENHYDQQAFSEDRVELLAAKIALVKNFGQYVPAEGGSVEDLRDNASALREELMKVAASSAAVKSGWGETLEEKAKDQAEFKRIIVAMVGESPELAARYFVDLKSLSGDPAAFEKAILKIVKRYPDLRPSYTADGFVGSIVGWAPVKGLLNTIGVAIDYPTYTFMDNLRFFIFLILIAVAFGEALMVPAIYAALRSYTNKRTSGTAFNFQYLTMNIGAVMSFAIFDWLRQGFGNESIMIFGTMMAVICTIATLFLRPNLKVEEDGSVKAEPPKPKADKEMPWTIAASVVKETAFWRFMLFIGLLIGVRLTFTHQFLVMPKYYTRVLGDDAPIGLMNTINPTIITIGLIAFIPIIMRFSVFKLIVLGTFVSAASVFFLALPGKLFTPFGWTIEQGYLFLILAQVVVFAFGELIWSPRLSEYTVTIAPKGREGSYMSMAVLPMFIAKPLNGWLSGLLLTEYCPEGVMADIVSGARSWYNGPEMMWIIFGVIALSSPFLVLLLRNVIRSENEEDAEGGDTDSAEGDEETQPQES